MRIYCITYLIYFENVTKMCDLNLFNAASPEGRSEDVPNSSPLIILSKRDHVMKIPRKNALKKTVMLSFW